MKRRCRDKNFVKYPEYGGKGITYDPRWEKFKYFLDDMGERPEGMTLDRYPDRKGNYCKSNCRWATPTEQSNNRNLTYKKGKAKNPVKGVRWHSTKNTWISYKNIVKGSKVEVLYRGKDFFEAVCFRKSYELKEL
jgi:hypothetical protein